VLLEASPTLVFSPKGASRRGDQRLGAPSDLFGVRVSFSCPPPLTKKGEGSRPPLIRVSGPYACRASLLRARALLFRCSRRWQLLIWIGLKRWRSARADTSHAVSCVAAEASGERRLAPGCHCSQDGQYYHKSFFHSQCPLQTTNTAKTSTAMGKGLKRDAISPLLSPEDHPEMLWPCLPLGSVSVWLWRGSRRERIAVAVNNPPAIRVFPPYQSGAYLKLTFLLCRPSAGRKTLNLHCRAYPITNLN
jgi:hypothetical protein